MGVNARSACSALLLCSYKSLTYYVHKQVGHSTPETQKISEISETFAPEKTPEFFWKFLILEKWKNSPWNPLKIIII